MSYLDETNRLDTIARLLGSTYELFGESWGIYFSLLKDAQATISLVKEEFPHLDLEIVQPVHTYGRIYGWMITPVREKSWYFDSEAGQNVWMCDKEARWYKNSETPERFSLLDPQPENPQLPCICGHY